MVKKITAAQKKKLKEHAKVHTDAHMRAMVKEMKKGATFEQAHAIVSGPSQKQKQSQKVVVNLGTPAKRRRKPRASARPNSARVLSQFVQPEQMLPDRRVMINPIILPADYIAAQAPTDTRNAFAVRAPAVDREQLITGRATPDAPLMTPAQARSVGAARAMARSINKDIEVAQERDQEAERGLMASEDALSFMTQNPRKQLVGPEEEDLNTPARTLFPAVKFSGKNRTY